MDFGAGRDGVQLGAGLGLDLGSFQISVSAARRAVAFGSENAIMFSLLSHTF
jgi:hypothetical protein